MIVSSCCLSFLDCVRDLKLAAVDGARLTGQVDRHRDAPSVAVRGQARDELVQSFVDNRPTAVH